ncbi:MAG TPA: imidazoleglycerol-phosphate dehydratase [Candidatus Omnitrophota bacterium]|nr:imidazoleglycerol-phosphate dehydratase [Candidatus Omnitrophota bacterium]HSA31046.1 imidazoleglycerol-phosphate dehydratase [Candidatus Omnitrophota bacterium]
MQNARTAELERKSKETEIRAVLNIDGTGKTRIKTQIGFLDHMLELFAFHGCFDLDLEVQKADLEIDPHHTNEDIGIVLGKIFKKALGEKEGIRRFGSGFAPMESTIGHSVVDISGRGYLTLDLGGKDQLEQEGYKANYVEHFLESFAHSLDATIYVEVKNASDDLHTNLETVFKSLGLALEQATSINPKRKGNVPSTKGIID